MSKSKSRNYKVLAGKNVQVLVVTDKNRKEKKIPMVKYYDKDIYIALLPEDMELDGKIYPKGTIIEHRDNSWADNDSEYAIITDPKYDDKYYNISKNLNNWLGVPALILKDIRNLNTRNYNKYSEYLTPKSNWIVESVKNAENIRAATALASAGLEGGAIGAVTANLPSSEDISSTTSTSSSPSFDFIDDILGTKSIDTEKGNTDYDPNEVANNTVSNSSLSKIRKDTVNELVLAYSKAMQSILDNYGNKDMYNLYSRDSI